MKKFIVGTVAAGVTFAVGAAVTGLHEQKKRIEIKLQRNELAFAMRQLKDKIVDKVTS